MIATTATETVFDVGIPSASELNAHLDAGPYKFVEQKVASNPKWRGARIKHYLYDADHFHVVRLDFDDGRSKIIMPIRRDSDGWGWGDPPGPLPLYRADGVAGDGPIHVTEGEKTTNILHALGLVATTSSHGSGSAGRSDWTPLANKSVVVLPDAGESGAKYAADVVDLLGKLDDPPTSIKVVTFPNLQDGEDIEQFIERLSDGTDAVAALAELADGTAPIRIPHAKPGGPFTELWLSERFVDDHGDDLRWSLSVGWLVWNDIQWRRDDSREIDKMVTLSVRNLYRTAADTADPKERKALIEFGRGCERHARFAAVEALARHLVAIDVDTLDVNPWLLNLSNGTFNLRTGKLQPHRREDFITQLAPVAYDPAAQCPNWLAFLRMIMGGDDDLVDFLQRAAGYSLTGDTSERCMFVLHGGGSNGKSTYVETLADLLGDHGLKTPTSMLMRKRGGEIPTDVARLRGIRFVTASESEQGAKLAESLVKDLTGCDTVAARFLHHDYFDFRPICKLWLSTNHKPLITGTDDAVWSRIRLIPFAVRIPDPKPRREVKAMFDAEMSGILNWALEGCREWLAGGLQPPEKVRDATAEYRSESDSLGSFLVDQCIQGDVERTATVDMYASYKAWCADTADDPLGSRAFATVLEERGFFRRRYGPGRSRFWFKVGLTKNETE